MKKRIIFVICLMLTLILAVVVVITISANKTSKKKENIEGKKEYRVYNEKTDGNLINKMTLTYNGKTLTIPFKVSDLISIGFKYRYDTDKTMIIKPNSFNIGGSDLLIGDSKESVHVIAYNTTDKQITFGDCYVTNISSSSDKITMNKITPKKSTYYDLLEYLGKDDSKRRDDFEEEKNVGKSEMRQLNLKYWVDGSSEYIGNRAIDDIGFQVKIKEDGLVESVSMEWLD